MVLGASVGSWLLAALFGWTEFAFVAAALLALFLLACVFTIGPNAH
jgi:predicted MFS family arabinose efflux permease